MKSFNTLVIAVSALTLSFTGCESVRSWDTPQTAAMTTEPGLDPVAEGPRGPSPSWGAGFTPYQY